MKAERTNQREPGVLSRRKRAQTISKTKKSTDLNQVHLAWLKNPDILKEQTGMTLQERATSFMQRFPGKKLSRSRLQRLYKEFRIKRKKIKLTKTMNYNAKRRFKKSLNTAREELEKYISLGYRIV